MKKLINLLAIIAIITLSSCRASFYTGEFTIVDKKPSKTEGYYLYKLKNVNPDKPRRKYEHGYYSWYRDSVNYLIGDTFRFVSTDKEMLSLYEALSGLKNINEGLYIAMKGLVQNAYNKALFEGKSPKEAYDAALKEARLRLTELLK